MLLEMKHIHKRFAGVHALNDVSLELQAGEVHALLGENGAGKSTLIKVLGGIYSADEGEIWIDGKQVEIKGVKDAQSNGIAIIHQELVLVPYMTVAENIFLGREFGNGIFVNRTKMNEEAQKLLDENQVHIKADTLVGKLTIAQQQMVEIVKAISYNSRILVMDEPTSSIADKEVEFLFETMRKLTKKGVGIIYISHKMSELEEICDKVTVMRDGDPRIARRAGDDGGAANRQLHGALAPERIRPDARSARRPRGRARLHDRGRNFPVRAGGSARLASHRRSVGRFGL